MQYESPNFSFWMTSFFFSHRNAILEIRKGNKNWFGWSLGCPHSKLYQTASSSGSNQNYHRLSNGKYLLTFLEEFPEIKIKIYVSISETSRFSLFVIFFKLSIPKYLVQSTEIFGVCRGRLQWSIYLTITYLKLHRIEVILKCSMLVAYLPLSLHAKGR